MRIEGGDEKALIFIEEGDECWEVLVKAQQTGAMFERDGLQFVRLVFPRNNSRKPKEPIECSVLQAQQVFAENLLCKDSGMGVKIE